MVAAVGGVATARRRLLITIAMPAPPKISPKSSKARPAQSTRFVFAPTITAALTLGAPPAFIRTIVQSPPLTFQVAVTCPVPLLVVYQKPWRAGEPAGALPGCVLYETLLPLTSVTWLRETPPR